MQVLQQILPETQQFLLRMQRQPAVEGIVLLGSKSRGYADLRSDDDVEVFVSDEV